MLTAQYLETCRDLLPIIGEQEAQMPPQMQPGTSTDMCQRIHGSSEASRDPEACVQTNLGQGSP